MSDHGWLDLSSAMAISISGEARYTRLSRFTLMAEFMVMSSVAYSSSKGRSSAKTELAMARVLPAYSFVSSNSSIVVK